jgi:ribonucleotide reductase beta subunit family protein with ferritin-like domain
MTYNVWSCEHVAVYRRIQSICQIIERHDPDVIFLQVLAIYYAIFLSYIFFSAFIISYMASHCNFMQEVTDYIYNIFEEAPWWRKYERFSSKEEKKDLSYNASTTPFCLVVNGTNI